jgi:hypothetical protein
MNNDGCRKQVDADESSLDNQRTTQECEEENKQNMNAMLISEHGSVQNSQVLVANRDKIQAIVQRV